MMAENIAAKAHFVTFFSPGTFVAESTTKEIQSWDVNLAVAMMTDIKERHGARPYGFRFTTRGRAADELDSKVIASSPMHFVGGKIETREEIEARNDPSENILRSNMRENDIERIWVTTEGWKWTQPLSDSDIVVSA